MKRPNLETDTIFCHKTKAFYETEYSKELEKYADFLESEIKELKKQVNSYSTSNSLDLRELEHKLDEALGKETRKTLTEWIKQQR